MSLLHATWLSKNWPNSNCPVLFLWADQWKVATPANYQFEPSCHPYALTNKELKNWLSSKELLPQKLADQSACLTLPSKVLKAKIDHDHQNSTNKAYPSLPLQAEELISNKYEWWPWKIEGIALTSLEASRWLAQLPLNNDSNLGEELLWWTHLQRWSLNLIAHGLWLPQVKLNTFKTSQRARWVPLLNQENERKRLEEFTKRMPLVTNCAVPWKTSKAETSTAKNSNKSEELSIYNPLASFRPRHNRLEVMEILEEILDAQLRNEFKPNDEDLDPLLAQWQEALGSENGSLDLDIEDTKRLVKATRSWKEGLSTKVRAAKTCLQLIAPVNNDDPWQLEFLLQAEADDALKVSACKVWASDSNELKIGNIKIEEASEILLEGLGRTLKYFPVIERGLEIPTPTGVKLSPAEAFVLIKTAAAKLRDCGVGVILPKSLSKGLASRLGITITAELKENSQGTMLREKLQWNWEFMIGGIKLTIQELARLSNKKSPLLNHKGTWIELRPNDKKNTEEFIANPPELSLNEALQLTATEGNTLKKLPVHHFAAGPRLKNVLEQYHHQKKPEAIATPEGFIGKLRPYQQLGLGWLAFLNRFNQGACLADDMGLGKTIQLLAFIQHLKNLNELSKPLLLIAPTSVLTNWKREASKFTPELCLMEHYGSKRCSDQKKFREELRTIDILLTSYGLLYRDNELFKEINWHGIVIDEAQTIKNPKSKQSLAIRNISQNLTSNPLKIALTGTPIENRVSEIWAMMNFLNPKVLGDENFFNQRYKLPIEHYGDISSMNDLKIRVNPFILRRIKTDKSIISDLPKKIELIEWINLSKEQQKLYNQTVEKSLTELNATSPNLRHGKTLGLLTRLKQICNHPALALKEKHIDTDFFKRSTKLQRLEEILDEVIASNERALLFTQFSEWGSLLQQYLERKYACEIFFLHGGTSKNNRQIMIDRFQEDPRGPNLFLLSLKAGGLGLNLTRASHVFHIDRWWNPAVENQATDRAYRIGQTKSVMVHKFIIKGSIEEKIHQMIIKKSKLAEDIVGSGENWLSTLNIEDLRKLIVLDNNHNEF